MVLTTKFPNSVHWNCLQFNVKSCDFTEVNIFKYNAINYSCFINTKFQTGCSEICCPLYSMCIKCGTFEKSVSYLTNTKSRSNIKTSKQLFLILVTYFHWWCNIIFIFVNNENIHMIKIIFHIYYIYIIIYFSLEL